MKDQKDTHLFSIDTRLFIEKNVEALRTATDKGASDIDMLCVVLGFLFDFNFLYIYETNDGINFHKNNEFKKSPLSETPKFDDYIELLKAAFQESKATSIQKEEKLKDNILLVNAIAAIPLFVDNTQKILIVCKQFTGSMEEVFQDFVFNSYELERYLSVIKIFSQVHEKERQLIHSEKLAELGTLTAGIAHEINNPLNTIITKLRMLQDYVSDFKQFLIEFKDDNRLLLSKTKRLNAEFIIERLEKSIQLPLEMAERVSNTVKILKRFAASDTHELEFVEVNDLLDEALEVMWHKIKHKAVVVKNYGKNLRPVKTSPNRLCQVMVNILDNATDAISDHGNIKITTWQNNKEIVVEIMNDGAPITKENLMRLFTPYFTTKEHGLGLGLYISRHIIKELNGSIAAESIEGKGTIFKIRLPLERKNEDEKA